MQEIGRFKKNGESTSARSTVKGNGGSATAVFSEAGTFEVERTYPKLGSSLVSATTL